MQKSKPDVSVLQVLKQDERTLGGQFLRIERPYLRDGPSNDEVFIAQKDKIIKKDSNNNFKAGQNFGSINAFGVCTLVLEMYNQDMDHLKSFYIKKGGNKRFDEAFKVWQRRKPIGIYPYEDELKANAHYTRGKNPNYDEIHFYSFKDDEGRLQHTSHMFDVIAHETGHAVLDRLRPDFNNVARLQTRGLHESFGDLTAMFTVLNDPELRADLLAVTKGDLHKKSFLPAIAEAFNDREGLRNALYKIEINNVECEEHSLSQVVTGAIYDILARAFDDLEKANPYASQKAILEHVQNDLRKLVLRTIIELADSNPSFSDVGKKMEEIAKEDLSRLGYIYNHIADAFKERGIDIEKEHTSQDECDIKRSNIAAARNPSICGTLNHLCPSDKHKDLDLEFLKVFNKTMKFETNPRPNPKDRKALFEDGKGI